MGQIYISTDPNNNVPIGSPGQGISIGQMGTNIYNANPFLSPTAGDTINISANPQSQLTTYNVDGTTTFATLTFNFINGFAPRQQIALNFQQNVSTIVFSGSTFSGIALPGSVNAGVTLVFLWDNTGLTWARVS